MQSSMRGYRHSEDRLDTVAWVVAYSFGGITRAEAEAYALMPRRYAHWVLSRCHTYTGECRIVILTCD